jgi:hypothetical protein
MTIQPTDYESEILDQRRQREQALLADRSWFTLAGLFWLQEGENRFGSSPDGEIMLPGVETPGQAGHFTLKQGRVTLHAAPGVTLAVNEEPTSLAVLRDDRAATPDYVTLGDLTMLVIRRGERHGIRLWDKKSPERQKFAGLRWYPIDPAWCLITRFVPYEPAKLITYTDVLDDQHEAASPGAVIFRWQGEEYCLDAQAAGKRLFFNFGDATNRESTYGAGRFLFSELPQNGEVMMDFNLATSPYCAYTTFATCPLPPAQNRLALRVEAGEQRYAREYNAQV